ncbi:hypothetical protein CMI47_02495 [Candidatus Pacearchaeota archaeon]|nr:hypothetical protein [Candidatus Pacearchaeota archaeon]
MTTLETVLVCALVVMVISTIIASLFAVKFALLILRVEDAIEESLDILDERYASITEIVEIPLFSDSPQIRQVHTDLTRSREAILLIANILTDDFSRLKDNNDGPKKDT